MPSAPVRQLSPGHRVTPTAWDALCLGPGLRTRCPHTYPPFHPTQKVPNRMYDIIPFCTPNGGGVCEGTTNVSVKRRAGELITRINAIYPHFANWCYPNAYNSHFNNQKHSWKTHCCNSCFGTSPKKSPTMSRFLKGKDTFLIISTNAFLNTGNVLKTVLNRGHKK